MTYTSTGKFVRDFFGNMTGKFLEIGAWDGRPSDEEPYWDLLTTGWYGVYCEPNPHSIPSLIQNVSPYNADIVTAAIGTTAGIQPFNASTSHPYISSFDSKWHLNLPPTLSETPYVSDKIYAPTITIDQIFETFGYDFDTISVDIEVSLESELEIFKTIDFNKLPVCKLVISETYSSELQTYMESFGFIRKSAPPNNYWIRA
ncbi:MAG: hypothetical protein EBU66_04135 [Bacteroidetes bacterium]|nr:hypothetical protein [bacterium]NBP63856.1 hypothetical protein [Bacteroidota bacterium]